ncbi:PLP-dependent transferase [Candidatus Daviesbacteria bacterium]|nr:PLP-dependent transferase [Candidatus Daviesbacteria bacterium]
MNTTEIKTRVPSFPNIEAVQAAQLAKKEQREADLYPRDGSRELFGLERDIAEMLGVRPGNLLLYNTGMSAVVDALEILRPTAGTRILRATEGYSQARGYINDELKSRGVAVVETNAQSTQELNQDLEAKRPDIVFLETVTNGSEMAVLNVDEFLNLSSLRKLDPLIILDNTLPTSTGLPLGQILETSDRKIIGVESGTKFLGLNAEMCGMAYTYNLELLSLLRKRRQRTGSLLSASAAETIRDCMPGTAEEYYRRNKAIFKHTLRLARVCVESQNPESQFVVNHPNLPNHENSYYVNLHAPDGISPVLFLVPADLDSHVRIAEALWSNLTISSLCDLGQSFGFDRTRIWPDDSSPVVRVSGGIYSEAEQAALDKAFYQVLSDYQ